MSARIDCVLEMKCSLAVLRRALLNIMPEWEKYLLIDETGKLPLYRYNSQVIEETGYSIIIPGPKHHTKGGGVADFPANRHVDNDWGFTLVSGTPEEGQWKFTYADYNSQKAAALEKKVLAEVATMHTRARNELMGYQTVQDRVLGEERIIEVLVPLAEMPGYQEGQFA
jgi:hypothetical protein